MKGIKIAIEKVAKDLSTSLKVSVCIRIECWNHFPEVTKSYVYKISLVPGLDEGCTQLKFKTWEDLLTKVTELQESN